MKQILAIILALICVVFSVNAQTRSVEVQATGKYYNKVWKNWSDETLRSYVDKEGNFYISGGSTLIGATGYIASSKLPELIAALEKSQEWALKAKEAQLETTKELASFMSGSGHEEQGVTLNFFAANKGEQTDVILSIKDFDNMFKKIDLYLNPDQVKQFLIVLSKVPETVKALGEQGTKANDILK
jgi:hypothetical protein